MSVRTLIHRFALPVSIATVVCLMSACSSSGAAPCTPTSPEAVASAPAVPSTPVSTPTAITVAPAVGEKLGVVAQGKSVKDDPSSNGLKYSCASTEVPVSVGFDKKVEYNGTTVAFDTTYPHTSDGLVDTSSQDSVVTLTFTGHSLHATSAIVSFVNVVIKDDPAKDVFTTEDDQVVNLSSVNLMHAGVTLTTSDFLGDGAFIGNITLCV